MWWIDRPIDCDLKEDEDEDELDVGEEEEAQQLLHVEHNVRTIVALSLKTRCHVLDIDCLTQPMGVCRRNRSRL